MVFYEVLLGERMATVMEKLNDKEGWESINETRTTRFYITIGHAPA